MGSAAQLIALSRIALTWALVLSARRGDKTFAHHAKGARGGAFG